MARRLNDGTYKVPPDASARAPAYGTPFSVHDVGLTWSCRLQNRGLSGPSYAVRCNRVSARISWQVG
jgi:hypothetical protein